MPLQHRVCCTAALRDVHSDRAHVTLGVVPARSPIRGFARIRRKYLVTPNGAFDRAAIMAAAVEAAKVHQLRTGVAWSVSMSVGLIAAWQAAKAARLSVVTREPGLTESKRKDARRGGLPPLRTEEGEDRAAR